MPNNTPETNSSSSPAGDDEHVRRFIQLLISSQNSIYSYILSLVPRSSDADDIMQETSAIMWQKFGDFLEGTDFRRWGIAIARNLVFRYWKKQKRTQKQLSEAILEKLDGDFRDMLDEVGPQLDILRNCVKKLDEPDRHLISLRYKSDLPVKEIAAKFDKTVQAIYKALGRVHNILLRCVRRSMNAGEIA